MRKNLLGISILSIWAICCLTACKDDEISIEEQNRLSDTYVCPPVPDGQIGVIAEKSREGQFVGAGYDVMGDYLSISSVKSMVLNLPDEELDSIGIRSSFATTYEGVDVKDFLRSITRKNEIDIPSLYSDDLLFTGTISNSEHFSETDDYSSQYTFVCEEPTWTEIRVQTNTISAKALIPYLTERFKNDLESISPQALIEEYGTHVLKTANLGSRVRSLYRTVVATDENKYAQPAFYGLTARRKKIYKNHVVISREPENEVAKNHGSAIYVECCGGDNSRVPHLLLTPNEVIGDPMDLTEWNRSLNASNYALSELRGRDMIPIYDLVADPVKKEQIKKAVQEYIHKNQLKEVLTTPIYQGINGMHHRYFNSYKDYSENAETAWTCGAPLGGLYVNLQFKTEPLYQYTNGLNDRFSSEYHSEGMDGMTFLRIAGYTCQSYNSQNTTILYEIWNGKDDYAYTTEDKKSYGNNGSWKKTGKEWYIKKF